MNPAPRPFASLSLDLDDEWAYLMTRGDASWLDHPSYLPVVVPRVLNALASIDQRITFFVVGYDAAQPRNHELMRSLTDAGHGVGNHSFRHQPWLHRYSYPELVEEFSRAEDALEASTGIRPTGFRGPGYSLSADVLRVLVERGYRYDASTLPTVIGPLSRAFYFRSADLTAEQRAERSQLFGSWRDGLRPLRAYQWETPGVEERLLELPVTTLPLLRVPIHVSYLLYLAAVSPRLAKRYFALALGLCARRGVAPSILLHPLDFLGAEDVSSLAFFPGMDMAGPRKVELVLGFVRELQRRFEVVTVDAHADRVLAQDGDLPVRADDVYFASAGRT